MATNCLGIVVAKLINTHIGQELADPDEGEYSEYIELNTVSKLDVQQELVWDEGRTRVLYVEHTVSVEAILTQSNVYGPIVEQGSDPDQIDFDTKLERITRFLQNQGLAINFSSYPSPIRRVASGRNSQQGWLIDNFNGPKPLSTNVSSLAGSESVALSWQTQYRTTHWTQPHQSAQIPPKISSELRLDIDPEGDIVINLSGTIYADSKAAILAARDWLDLQYQAPSIDKIVANQNANFEEDQWAMVNGFLKDVTFNIARDGYSATFMVKYTQVKSNNAYPLGIRDIEFEQTIESALLAKSLWAGKGFRTWRNAFRGKIKIPSRLSAEYAWYIFHLLCMQTLKLTEIPLDTKSLDLDDEDVPLAANQQVGERLSKKRTVTRAIPFRLKITHGHFNKSIQFELDYVLVSPLAQVLTTSGIFSRLHNDYQRRLNQPNNVDNYEPFQLSQQWYLWNTSIDVGQGFDPTQPNAQNVGTQGRPHRDTAGLEIVDTGHQYDPLLEIEEQAKQRNVLIATTFDPNENDPSYDPANRLDGNAAGKKNTSIPSAKAANGRDWDDAIDFSGYHPGKAGLGLQAFSSSRKEEDVDPRVSWIQANEFYEILETNPTVPTESLGDTKAEKFTAKTENANSLYNDLELDPTIPVDSRTPSATAASENIELTTGAQFMGRTNPETDDTEEPNYVRKTYATKPTRQYVKVRGYAMRLKYKIPCPTVVTIAGEPAIRVGTGRFFHKEVSADADTPVYMAMWEQTYTVDKNIQSDDILQSIESTGASILYA